jgi:hypothetical protein
MRAAPPTGVQRYLSDGRQRSITGGMTLVLDYLLSWFERVSAEMRASLEPMRD